MTQTLPIDEITDPSSKMAEPDARAALQQKLAERDKARAALVEVVQEEDERIAALREKRAQDREMRRKEAEAPAVAPPAAQQPRRRRRRKPVSDVEDARRQAQEQLAVEAAERAPAPDPRDAGRQELWKELGEYGASLRERVDFPENYDEVVQLMGRRDLAEEKEGWSEAALAGGDFSRYANLFDDDEKEKKLRAGLATIERLDRELAKVHAKARAVRSLQLPPPPDVRPSSAASTRSTSTTASGAFVTQKRLHKRIVPKGEPTSPGSEAPAPTRDHATDFILNNKVTGGDKMLLTFEQQHRADQLDLQKGEDENDAVLRDLSAYGEDDARLREIDAELAALGRDADDVLRDAEARAAAVAASARDPANRDVDDANARNFLAIAREAREIRAAQADVDARLAEVRAKPLVLLDDEDEEMQNDYDLGQGRGTTPSEVKRLVEEVRDVPNDVPRERLDELLASLRDDGEAPSQLAIALRDAAAIRHEKRGDDARTTPRRDYQTFGGETYGADLRRRDAEGLEDALLEASLKAEQALRHSDEVLARSGLAV